MSSFSTGLHPASGSNAECLARWKSAGTFTQVLSRGFPERRNLGGDILDLAGPSSAKLNSLRDSCGEARLARQICCLKFREKRGKGPVAEKTQRFPNQ
jgi:hypothetical protein